MSSIRYRPEIDGLRAVAVIPVVLFHLGYKWVSGGFVGVDVFFVISGFLITSIILKESAKGDFSFADFWGRRAKRILPPMLAMLIATLAASYWLLMPPEVNRVALHTMATIASVANFSMWTVARDYWGPAAENSPLLHAWSLAVEEQFYLFFPALLILMLRVLPRFVVPIMVALNLISFGVYLYAADRFPSAAFFLLPFRAWELGVGCLLAILIFRQHLDPVKANSTIGAGLGLAAILGSVFLMSGTEPFMGQLAIPVLGAAAIIACAANPSNPVHRLLAARPVVYVGQISYSLYLWHWPVMVLARLHAERGGVHLPDFVILGTIFGLASLSYHFVENPTRRASGIIPPIIAVSVVLLVISFFVHRRDVEPDTTIYETPVSVRLLYETSVVRDAAALNATTETYVGVDLLMPTPAEQEEVRQHQRMTRSFGTDGPSYVIFGDSHGIMWAPVVEELAKETSGTVTFLTVASGRNRIDEFPLNPASPTFKLNQTRLETIERLRPDYLFVAQRWSDFLTDAEGSLNQSDAETTVRFITHLTKHAGRVIVIGQAPEQEIEEVSAPQFLAFGGFVSTPENPRVYLRERRADRYQTTSAWLQSSVAPIPGVTFVPTRDLFMSPEGKVLILDGRQIVYSDAHHLTLYGALLALDRFRGELTKP